MDKINVRFREMNDEEYKQFLEESVLSYSKSIIKSEGISEEEALQEAQKTFDEFLPQGKYTENNYLYIIVNNENEDVGVIWYSKYEEKVAFIGDFLIFEKFRKRGYGKRAMLLIDKDAKEKGFNKVMLHVFKFNDVAFSLYNSVGYKVVDDEDDEDTGFIMVKDI